MTLFSSIADLISMAKAENCLISKIVLRHEAETAMRKESDIREELYNNWLIMDDSVCKGLISEQKSVSGLTGGDAVKLYAHMGKSFLGNSAVLAAASAVAVSELNACMGRVVACPTAGACGIYPAVMHVAFSEHGYSKDEMIDAALTASGIGMVIEKNASIAGAYGGCQAECGTAAGMAAGALVQLGGGSPEQVGEGVALAVKNLLGLACDPVAGLVEVPCVKRNGFVAVHAMLAADMALAGVKSVIPVDEVIDSMDRIGRMMPSALKETAEGGLATSKTGRELAKKIFAD